MGPGVGMRPLRPQEVFPIMADTAQTLRELHRLHIQLADIRSRLARGPRLVKAEEGKITNLESAVEDAKERTKQSRLQASQKELQLAERESKILEIRGKLNTCSSNREYQAFLEQIAAHEQANSVLSDEILETFDKISELEGEIKEREQELAQGKGTLAELCQRVETQKQSLETDLARLTEELQETEKGLDAEIRGNYLRAAKGRGEEALAPVEGETCQGCYQTITAQMVSELIQSMPVTCKSCGRLLYLPESRRVGS